MTDQSLVQLLRQNDKNGFAATICEYRRLSLPIDLSGAELSDTDFSGLDLSRVDFSCANLTGANLTETILESAQLGAARLEGSDLANADLSNANLYGVSLFRVKGLSSATFCDTALDHEAQKAVSEAKFNCSDSAIPAPQTISIVPSKASHAQECVQVVTFVCRNVFSYCKRALRNSLRQSPS